MVEKSLEEWHQRTQPDRVLARQPAARSVVDALLAEAGIVAPDTDQSVPLPVTAIEYDAWIAVSAAIDDASPNELVAQLVNEFGSEAAAKDAFALFYRLRDRLDREEQATGKPARLERLPKPTAAADRAFLDRVRPERPRMTRTDIFIYSGRRAAQLGFSPADIWAKQQGVRRADAAELKAARARIVVELRDRNATGPDIGAVFGGRDKSAIRALERFGRKAIQEGS